MRDAKAAVEAAKENPMPKHGGDRKSAVEEAKESPQPAVQDKDLTLISSNSNEGILRRLARDGHEELLGAIAQHKDLHALLSKHRPSKSGPKGGRPKKSETVDNVNGLPQKHVGNSRAYIEQRLQRDHPDAAEFGTLDPATNSTPTQAVPRGNSSELVAPARCGVFFGVLPDDRVR